MGKLAANAPLFSSMYRMQRENALNTSRWLSKSPSPEKWDCLWTTKCVEFWIQEDKSHYTVWLFIPIFLCSCQVFPFYEPFNPFLDNLWTWHESRFKLFWHLCNEKIMWSFFTSFHNANNGCFNSVNWLRVQTRKDVYGFTYKRPNFA